MIIAATCKSLRSRIGQVAHVDIENLTHLLREYGTQNQIF